VDLHHVSKHVDRILGTYSPGDMDCQALAGVCIDHHHQFDRATVIGAVEHEVPRPDVPGPLWAQPDTRPIVQPEPPAPRLLVQHL